MPQHPLKCKTCGDYKRLEIYWVRYKEEKDKELDFNIPFYICPKCGDKEPLNAKEYYDNISKEEFEKMKDGDKYAMTFSYEDAKFPQYNHLEFKYAPEDYYLIPGLLRPENDGYLIPVFFDKDVLLYYNNHPDYTVRFGSFSSGNIYHKDERLFNWGFGINRNGKIFMWLGDLASDFKSDEMKSHLRRFQASNVASDHDIYSKFYLSQNPFSPADAFQDSDNEIKLFTLKNQLDEIFMEKFTFNLTKIAIEDLFEFYKPPILEEKEQIFNAYISLNKLIVENIQIDKLKEVLLGEGAKKEIKQLGSLKTLELFLKEKCKIESAQTLMTPFFILSDLRQLQGHFSDSSFEERYNSCKIRLGLSIEATHFEVYESLINMFIKSYEETIKNCN